MTAQSQPEFLFIPLTQGQFALVDFDAPAQVFVRKWRAVWNAKSQTFYAIRHARPIDGRRTHEIMHRMILGVNDKRIWVDHRNHCGLDNRRENLRRCTPQENARNSRSKGGSSQYKGVSFNKKNGKWTAAIMVRGKTISLGSAHETEEAAALAYNKKSLELFGEYAQPNEIPATPERTY